MIVGNKTYYSTSEAAAVMGRTTANTRHHLDPVGQAENPATKRLVNIYDKAEVDAKAKEMDDLHAGRLPDYTPPTKPLRKYKTKKRITDKDDPFGVMFKPKKQTRKCARCKTGELYEGEYICAGCRARNPIRNDLGLADAYC